jgi:hypothetical protein
MLSYWQIFSRSLHAISNVNQNGGVAMQTHCASEVRVGEKPEESVVRTTGKAILARFEDLIKSYDSANGHKSRHFHTHALEGVLLDYLEKHPWYMGLNHRYLIGALGVAASLVVADTVSGEWQMPMSNREKLRSKAREKSIDESVAWLVSMEPPKFLLFFNRGKSPEEVKASLLDMLRLLRI